MSTKAIGYGVEVCAGCVRPNCVPPDVVSELRERGVSRPVSSLSDPRLSYPEMFLMQQWDRTTDGPISLYSKQGDGCSQTVEFGEERWRRITTDLGDRTHIVEMGGNGRSRQWLESARLPELNEGLATTREVFDTFLATGKLAGGTPPESVNAPQDEVALVRARLDRLEAVDESVHDQVPSRPGEVGVKDEFQARYWETPCGWELSEMGMGDGVLRQARSFGQRVWALEKAPEGPVKVLYLDLEQPEKSFRQSS